MQTSILFSELLEIDERRALQLQLFIWEKKENSLNICLQDSKPSIRE